MVRQDREMSLERMDTSDRNHCPSADPAGTLGNSIKALRYLHETYGEDIYISIMNQYTPVRKFVNLELN